MTLSWLNHVPVHVFPLPVYPRLQAQRYEPIVLLHCAFTGHGEGEVVHSSISAANMKNRQSRTTCSYFCSREIKNRNRLACNPDKTEEDHLCSCFQSITLPGID